jgi:uncharacterized protein (TIGR02246 family)
MKVKEDSIRDAARTIRTMDREFMDNVAAKNASLVASLYADDARILMPGRPVVSGKSEILAFYKEALDGPVEAITLDTAHIEVSGDLAYTFGSNKILLKEPGGASREENGKYVAVYRRQPDGDWKIVVDSYSSNA